MKTTIQNSLANSFSYEEYRNHVTNLVFEGKTTGHEQTEALVHYTELNEARLKRLDKTIKIDENIQDNLKNLNKRYIWLVISEGWCGDAAQILPVINKMANSNSNIDLRIVLRDDNEALMNHFLTNGGKAIPKLIILDENLEILGDFGPRPEPARKLIADYKAAYGVIDETIKIELQKWYLQDKGLSIQNEIVSILKS